MKRMPTGKEKERKNNNKMIKKRKKDKRDVIPEQERWGVCFSSNGTTRKERNDKTGTKVGTV